MTTMTRKKVELYNHLWQFLKMLQLKQRVTYNAALCKQLSTVSTFLKHVVFVLCSPG